MASKKYYHSHSAGAFVTGFALLGLVGLFAAFILLPVFTVTKGDQTLVVTGFDYVTIGLGKFIRDNIAASFPVKNISLLTDYYNHYSGDNVLWSAIARYYYIFFGVLAAIFLFSLIFVAIEAILAIFWLLRGRIQFPGASASLGWTIFAFFAIDIGLLYAYLFFSNQILTSASDPASISFDFRQFLILGGVFLLALLISIIHILFYRDRRFQRRSEKLAQEERRAYQKKLDLHIEEPEPDKEIPDKGLPEGISEIGDHAFSKDTSLTIADIPAGITTLGAGAFSNCHNLRVVCIPLTVKEIGYNCFFNANRLKTINYAGTKNEWSKIIRGSNWLINAGTTIVNTLDGPITVDPKN